MHVEYNEVVVPSTVEDTARSTYVGHLLGVVASKECEVCQILRSACRCSKQILTARQSNVLRECNIPSRGIPIATIEVRVGRVAGSIGEWLVGKNFYFTARAIAKSCCPRVHAILCIRIEDRRGKVCCTSFLSNSVGLNVVTYSCQDCVFLCCCVGSRCCLYVNSFLYSCFLCGRGVRIRSCIE